jgi:hypothetical protein
MQSENRWNQWTIEDSPNALLGPEVQVAVDETISGGNKPYAVAYRDIFDKKKSPIKYYDSSFLDSLTTTIFKPLFCGY